MILRKMQNYYEFIAKNPGREIEFIKQFPGFHYYYFPEIWGAIQSHGQIEELIRYYQKLIIAFPQIEKLYPNLSDLYLRSGNIQKAIEYNRKAGKVIVDQLKAIAPYQSSPISPDFLIIGAQKSGTTSLYQYLCQHYQILPAIRKEVDFFSWKWESGIDWYLSHFPPKPDPKYFKIGEASPSYFDCWEAPERIASLFPQTKIIVILRNPTNRAISQYHHWRRIRLETRPLDLAIETQIANIKKKNPWNKPNHYIARGMYGKFLKRWIKFFPIDNIYVCKFERLISDPVQEINLILKFLELPCFPNFYTKNNFSREWNKTEEKKENDQKMTEKLNSYYEVPNNEFIKIINRHKILKK